MKDGVVKLKERCHHCKSLKEGIIIVNGPHFQLNCNECQKFIRFVGKTENFEYIVDDNPDTLQEINFKLDLIIDHLGISK